MLFYCLLFSLNRPQTLSQSINFSWLLNIPSFGKSKGHSLEGGLPTCGHFFHAFKLMHQLTGTQSISTVSLQ